MPLPFLVFFGLAAGALLAWAARAHLGERDRSPLASPGFACAAGYGALVVVPVAAYFVAVHGDWSYLYLFAWSNVPSAIDLAFVLVAGLSVPTGFLAAAPWAAEQSFRKTARVVVPPLLLLLVLALIFRKALALSGSYAEVHGDFGTTTISRSHLGRGVLASAVALSTAFAWAYRGVRELR